MIWTIARKEFLTYVMTLRFVIAVAVCVGLMAASAAVLVSDYERRLEGYSRSVQNHTKGMDGIKVLSQVKAWADRSPSPLGFLASGKERDTGMSVEVSHIEAPTEADGKGRANPLLVIFSDVHPVQVVGTLVSLLVLLFAYDAVSGERERGTLSLTFAGTVSRATFLAGKYVGGMAVLSAVTLAGLLAAVALAVTSPLVDFDGEAWARIALVGVCSLAYVSLFFLLGLAASCRFRRSSTSLVVLFFVWICVVIVAPEGSPYLARRLRPVPPAQEIVARQEALDRAFRGRLSDYARQHGRPRAFWDWGLIIGRSVRSGDLPYAYRCLYAPREVMHWYRDGMVYALPQQMTYAEQKWEVYADYLRQQEAQARLARRLARVSPAWIYGHVAEILVGTDAEADRRFMDQARMYRRELAQYVEDQGGFSSMAYFTRMTERDLRPFSELKALLDARGKGTIQDLARPWTENLQPLRGIPAFQYRPESLRDGLDRAGLDIGLLVGMNAVLFALACGFFLKQDLRQEIG